MGVGKYDWSVYFFSFLCAWFADGVKRAVHNGEGCSLRASRDKERSRHEQEAQKRDRTIRRLQREACSSICVDGEGGGRLDHDSLQFMVSQDDDSLILQVRLCRKCIQEARFGIFCRTHYGPYSIP